MTKTCLMPSAGLAGPEVGLAPAAAGTAAAAVATQARTARSAARRRTRASGGIGGRCWLESSPSRRQVLSQVRIRLARVRATGIGSLPGDDIDAALALVFTELADFPHLPELPARGPGADMVGRTASVLVDLYVDLQPSGWRLVQRPGLDMRRACELMARDLDALVPVASTHDGPLKVQLAGPWTLAAALQTEHGPALADPGAVRDLVASYAEAVRAHLDEVRRRAPYAALTLQLDEPSLPAVLAGAVPTSSGLSRVRAVPAPDAEQALRTAITETTAAGVPTVVHCCAADVPLS